MMPSVLRFNRPATETAQSYLAEALGSPGGDAGAALLDLVKQLGLPQRLSEVGVREDKFELIANVAMTHVFTHSNPRPIRSAGDVIEILKLAA
jgi:alcohol dehydrogenase class IV